jgi:hypothetical protein
LSFHLGQLEELHYNTSHPTHVICFLTTHHHHLLLLYVILPLLLFLQTDGTEASFQHNRGDINCDRGYELWLVSEALKRNPNIIVYGLEWGAPGWVGNGSFFTPDMWDYKVQFCNCFQEKIGRPLDIIGIFNERYWGGVDYIIGLRNALNSAGFSHTRISLPDNRVATDTELLDAIANNATFSAAFDIAGQHSTPAPVPLLEATNHRYWESESGFNPISLTTDWRGAQQWAQILNRNYICCNITATITWSTIWSVLPGLPYDGRGIMMANTPWSGNYKDSAPLWISAHFGQFLEIGWKLLLTNRGSGILPPLNGGDGDAGSCVTYVPPADLSEMTIICETMTVTSAGARIFQLEGGLPGPGTILSVWQTTQGANFVQQPDVTVASDGTLTLVLPADGIVTASTIHTATHGQPSVAIPPSAPLQLPYRDSFNESLNEYDNYPKYLSDQGGSFACRNGSLVQVVTERSKENDWYTTPDPFTLLGDYAPWSDVTVGVTVTIPSQSSSLVTKLTDDPNAFVSVCETNPRNDSAQRWDFSEPYAGYLSNGGKGRQTACVNLYGCETRMIYYECCENCGCSNGDGFLFSLQANGSITSPLYPGLCASVLSTDNNTVSLIPCDASSSLQVWTHLSTTGQLVNAGTNKCLTSSFGLDSIYTQVCARVTSYTGFAGIAPVPGYCLTLNSTGYWSVLSSGSSLANGTLPSYNPIVPTTMAITTKGDLISANVDGVTLGTWSGRGNYSSGMVGFGSGVHIATFDDFYVESV